MAIFKCKLCGGALEINGAQTVAVCEYCGTKQTIPRLDDERRANLYDRANHFRRNNDFDKAAAIYETILNEDTSDAEAYWSLVLCRYGIEYVEDPATHRRIPTVNRAQFTSVFDDEDYKAAIAHADGYQREIYEAEAQAINEIQKGILAISQKEDPFDVFICYKETDATGRRTMDSVLATELYHELTREEGFKVFFSRITLENKLGVAYEPYIFAALHSAKVMVVIGTRPEHFNGVWVKNEWSRYLALIKNGAKKTLIPAYKDMDPYDLPEEFSHLQALDMSKLGFMQDLVHGIRKLVDVPTPTATRSREVAMPAIAPTGMPVNIAPLLKRAFLFLEMGEFKRADEFCEMVLNQDPENAEAYLGKMMAELQVKTRAELANCITPIENDDNFHMILRFGNEQIKAEVTEYARQIQNRIETEILQEEYEKCLQALSLSNTSKAYKYLAQRFDKLKDFKDAAALSEKCRTMAADIDRSAIYDGADSVLKEACNILTSPVSCSAIQSMIPALERAIKTFHSLNGWKDSDQKLALCRETMEKLKQKAKDSKTKEEQQRDAAQLRKKRDAKIAIIAIAIFLVVLLVILLLPQILKNIRYNDALSLMETGEYEQALTEFKSLGNFRSSKTKSEECQKEIEKAATNAKYDAAVELKNAGKYKEAIKAFEKLDGYRDSREQIEACETELTNIAVDNAMQMLANKNYISAYRALLDCRLSANISAKLDECISLWVDEILASPTADRAKSFMQTVYTHHSVVLQKISDHIAAHPEFSYWNDALTGTHHAQIVYYLLQTLNNISPVSSYSTFLNDCVEGRISSLNDYLDSNEHLIVDLWAFGCIRDAIVSDNSNFFAYLRGNWYTEDGTFYLKLRLEGSTNKSNYNLPHDNNGASYFNIISLVYSVANSFPLPENEKIDLFKFTVVDANTIDVYCFKNEQTYRLYRE